MIIKNNNTDFDFNPQQTREIKYNNMKTTQLNEEISLKGYCNSIKLFDFFDLSKPISYGYNSRNKRYVLTGLNSNNKKLVKLGVTQTELDLLLEKNIITKN